MDDMMMDAFVDETRDYYDEEEMQDLAEFLRGTTMRNPPPISMRIGTSMRSDLTPISDAIRTIADRPCSAGQFPLGRPPVTEL